MDISSYVKYHLQKEKKKERKIDKLYKSLKARVERKIPDLAEKYNLQRVYLFGSLTCREDFRLASDIDIAVEGLKPEDYLDLWGDLEESLEHSFDLVDMKKADGNLREYILREGV
ncbi:MAG: nucleotidyltransferase family protein, partial [Halanaerobiales bacterium]